MYENSISSNNNDGYKTNEQWKPNNISLMSKGGKPTLLYQKRSNECKHSISISLPSTPFDMYLYLVEMNTRIVNRYGKEYSIFYVPE